jgi:hypothetical protein
MTFLSAAAAASSSRPSARRRMRRPDIPFNWRLALALVVNAAVWALIIRLALTAL